MRAGVAIAGGLILAACGETARPVTVSAVPVGRTVIPAAPQDRVLGLDAAALTRMFGSPAADLREGSAHKLQFTGPICVLDAYLYPKNGREPVVTHIDARQSDGSPIDRASCEAALAHGVKQ